MVFSSIFFLFYFLPLTLLGYYLIRQELRNAYLLVVSLLFYGAGEPRFLPVMLLVIFISYVSGILLDASDTFCIWGGRYVKFCFFSASR